MSLRVLGCSGGVGGVSRTTSLLLDEYALIDAGTGIGILTLEEMEKIKHVFLTHSHLDHIACLPLMVDTMFPMIKDPIEIHGQPVVIEVLKKHIFNWSIWPDFSILPNPENPVMEYKNLLAGEVFQLGRYRLEMIPVNHIVPTVGCLIETDKKVLAFSSDTTTNDSFWDKLNAQDRIDILIVEVAFSNQYESLSTEAGHYCPKLLAQDLKKLRHNPDIFLTHNKPGDEDTIFKECTSAIPDRKLCLLEGGMVIEL